MKLTIRPMRYVPYLTIMVMEACWLYLIVDLANRWLDGGRLFVPGILLLFPLGFVINVLLNRPRWPAWLLYASSWSAWLALVFLDDRLGIDGLSVDLLSLSASAVIWWLSRRLVYHKGSYANQTQEFQIGLGAIVIAFFASSQVDVTPGNAVLAALTFFFAGLLGMSLTHAMEGSTEGKGGYRGPWPVLLLLSIAVATGIGFLAAELMNPGFLAACWEAITWGAGRVYWVIVQVMSFLLGLLPKPNLSGPPKTPLPGTAKPPREGLTFDIPEAVTHVAGYVLMVFVAIVVLGLTVLLVYAVWRQLPAALRWLRRSTSASAGCTSGLCEEVMLLPSGEPIGAARNRQNGR